MIFRLCLIGVSCVIALSVTDADASSGDKTQPSEKKEVKEKAAPAVPLDFLSFLRKAFETNPELQSARYKRKSQEAELLQALARFGPTVRLSATAAPKDMKNFPKPGTLADTLEKFSDTEYSTKGEVSGQINLFRGGADTFGMMAATSRQEYYDVEHSQVVQKFILDAAEVYVNVIKGRQELEVYTTFERQARHNFERVQTEYTVGSSTRTNVLTAKAELAQATSKRMKANTDLINAEQAYIEMSGEVAPKLSYPKNNLKLPTTLNESLDRAQANSLTARKAEAGLRSSRYNLAARVTGALSPSVDLTLKYNRSLDSGEENNPGNGSVGIQVSYELFSNSPQGNHMSQITQATHEKMAAGYGFEHARNAMVKEVKAAWHGLKTAESNRAQADLAVDAARNAYSGAVEEFRLGQRAYLDLLKVQEKLLNAELNHLEATKAEILGRYRLLASIGQLTPESAGLKENKENTMS